MQTFCSGAHVIYTLDTCIVLARSLPNTEHVGIKRTNWLMSPTVPHSCVTVLMSFRWDVTAKNSNSNIRYSNNEIVSFYLNYHNFSYLLKQAQFSWHQVNSKPYKHVLYAWVHVHGWLVCDWLAHEGYGSILSHALVELRDTRLCCYADLLHIHSDSYVGASIILSVDAQFHWCMSN